MIFIKKNPFFFKIWYTSSRNKKKTFPKAKLSSQLQKLRDNKERFYKIFRENNRKQHLIKWKKSQGTIQKSTQNEQEGGLGKFANFLNSHTPINQAWDRVRQRQQKHSH